MEFWQYTSNDLAMTMVWFGTKSDDVRKNFCYRPGTTCPDDENVNFTSIYFAEPYRLASHQMTRSEL